ncbi:unnamed protein product [Protopolystoma xenopodis]|uniref:Uncharacterized protein n=1 Tax=Protopolystoma xenopodis TaxID=117903 RepID=A0A448WYJ5_9PLAT|nr:unnamed protein product [Protopolystoma xenopodis]
MLEFVKECFDSSFPDINSVDWSGIVASGAVLIDFMALLRSSSILLHIPDFQQRFCNDLAIANTDLGHISTEETRYDGHCLMLIYAVGLAFHTVVYNSMNKNEDFLSLKDSANLQTLNICMRNMQCITGNLLVGRWKLITIQELDHEPNSTYNEEEEDEDSGSAHLLQSGAGRTSCSVSCFLNRDLVRCCLPGDIVHVNGIVDLLNDDVSALYLGHSTKNTCFGRKAGSASNSNKQSGIFTILLRVNSLIRVSARATANSGVMKSSEASEYTGLEERQQKVLRLTLRNHSAEEDNNSNFPSSINSFNESFSLGQ